MSKTRREPDNRHDTAGEVPMRRRGPERLNGGTHADSTASNSHSFRNENSKASPSKLGDAIARLRTRMAGAGGLDLSEEEHEALAELIRTLAELLGETVQEPTSRQR